MSKDQVIAHIDRAVKERAALEPPRTHLGASGIGNRCPRQTWYGFRWAYMKNHTGRLLRLFDRGHLEEERFVSFLREAGYEVREYAQRLMYHSASDSYCCIDWEDQDDQTWLECDDVSGIDFHHRRANKMGQGARQWGFSAHEGHYGGSCDGKVRGEHLGLPPGWGGLEFKTHSDKSFKDLVKKGVLTSKPVHWVQMQVYMREMNLPWCLYLAVNKNDDDLYSEIVHAKPEISEKYFDLAGKIINCVAAPERITEDPSWFECRFCDYREICHYGDTPHKNCRSCVNAAPSDNGTWYCSKYHNLIPSSFIPQGCDSWDPIK